MEQHDLIQGTQAWHEFRAKHFTASDAPAMLGVSPYKSRTELLREKATGITAEVDAATQRRFDDGHRFESLARPLAEEILGEGLFPCVGSEGRLAASFDGLTMFDDTCWEHKTLNDSLRGITCAADLPEHFRIQMEQQLMVSGASRCMFMATRWHDDNTLAEPPLVVWYEPDFALRERILQGWARLAIDLENYQHVEVAEKPKGATIEALPAVFVQASGMVTHSNLADFKRAATDFIGKIKTELVTDQDFSDADSMVKFCKQAEGNIESVKQAITGQMSSVDEALRTLDHISAQLRDKRLMLDKLVKSEKEARKAAMVAATRELYCKHMAGIQDGIVGVSLVATSPDFCAVIKGLKSLVSMQNALDTALANAKIEGDSLARDIRGKLDWFNATDSQYKMLFPDLAQIIAKPAEDFRLTVDSRINQHKRAEVERMERERQRIEAEARAKIEAEAAANLKADEERIRADERAKVEAEAKAQHPVNVAPIEPVAAHTTEAVAPVIPLRTEEVLDKQPVIAAFLRSRDFGREESRIRAILMKFVKFDGGYALAETAQND